LDWEGQLAVLLDRNRNPPLPNGLSVRARLEPPLQRDVPQLVCRPAKRHEASRFPSANSLCLIDWNRSNRENLDNFIPGDSCTFQLVGIDCIAGLAHTHRGGNVLLEINGHTCSSMLHQCTRFKALLAWHGRIDWMCQTLQPVYFRWSPKHPVNFKDP